MMSTTCTAILPCDKTCNAINPTPPARLVLPEQYVTWFLSSNSQGLDTRRRLLDAARISLKDALSSLVCVMQNRSSDSGSARSPMAAPLVDACAVPSLHSMSGCSLSGVPLLSVTFTKVLVSIIPISTCLRPLVTYNSHPFGAVYPCKLVMAPHMYQQPLQ